MRRRCYGQNAVPGNCLLCWWLPTAGPGSLKADSHIACRAHTVPLPCRAAKSLECVFPIWFTQCGRVWFTVTMPRPCHAPTIPLFSRSRHSTAVERRPVGYLPAFVFFRLPRGVPRRLLSEAYQSSSQRFIPTTVKSGSNALQKRRSVKLLDQQFGYFRLPRGLSRRTRHYRSMAGARHGMCELTARHGMGTACYVWMGLNTSCVSLGSNLHLLAALNSSNDTHLFS